MDKYRISENSNESINLRISFNMYVLSQPTFLSAEGCSTILRITSYQHERIEFTLFCRTMSFIMQYTFLPPPPPAILYY